MFCLLFWPLYWQSSAIVTSNNPEWFWVKNGWNFKNGQKHVSETGLPKRFEVLDSWRGICAVLVMLGHFQIFMKDSLNFGQVIGNNYIFVDFFFVLRALWSLEIILINSRLWNRHWDSLDHSLGRVFPLHLFVLILFLGFGICTLESRGWCDVFKSSQIFGVFGRQTAVNTLDGDFWLSDMEYPVMEHQRWIFSYITFAVFNGGVQEKR